MNSSLMVFLNFTNIILTLIYLVVMFSILISVFVCICREIITQAFFKVENTLTQWDFLESIETKVEETISSPLLDNQEEHF